MMAVAWLISWYKSANGRKAARPAKPDADLAGGEA